MREIDWVRHRRQREQYARDHGQWLGLVDQDGVPMVGLPQLSSMDWPETRGTPESIELSMRARTPKQRVHAAVDHLVAEKLGRVDAVGRLEPVSGPARLVALERPGIPRRAGKVTHVVADGDQIAPHTLTIHGVDLLGILDQLPCPSNPMSWTGEFTRFERDWVGPPGEEAMFEQPRDLASTTMITVADGASVEGDADEVIFRLIDESLQAVYRVAGITSNPPYVAVLGERKATSRRLILRPTDQTIWQEVGEAAYNSGVSIRAELWWPGDPQPVGQVLSRPTIVFTVTQEV